MTVFIRQNKLHANSLKNSRRVEVADSKVHFLGESNRQLFPGILTDELDKEKLWYVYTMEY